MFEAARIVGEALDAEGSSRAIVAAHLGVSERELGRCTSTSSGRHMPLGHVLGLPPAVVVRIAGRMVEPLGKAIVDLPKTSATSDELRALATAQRETAEAIAHGLDAMADGHMTRAEGARVEQECDEAIAALLVIRDRARLAQREGVIGLRAVSGGGR